MRNAIALLTVLAFAVSLSGKSPLPPNQSDQFITSTVFSNPDCCADEANSKEVPQTAKIVMRDTGKHGSKPEMAPMLQGKMFLMAGLLDAVPMIGVGIGMYLIFAVAPGM